MGTPSLQWTTALSLSRSFHRRVRLDPPVPSVFHRGQPNASALTAPTLKRHKGSGLESICGMVKPFSKHRPREDSRHSLEVSHLVLGSHGSWDVFLASVCQFRSALDSLTPSEHERNEKVIIIISIVMKTCFLFVCFTEARFLSPSCPFFVLYMRSCHSHGPPLSHLTSL